MAENNSVKEDDEVKILFNLKQKFLREIPHPTIIRKSAERLAKKAQLILILTFGQQHLLLG